jgi:hypothetical protein
LLLLLLLWLLPVCPSGVCCCCDWPAAAAAAAAVEEVDALEIEAGLLGRGEGPPPPDDALPPPPPKATRGGGAISMPPALLRLWVLADEEAAPAMVELAVEADEADRKARLVLRLVPVGPAPRRLSAERWDSRTMAAVLVRVSTGRLPCT